MISPPKKEASAVLRRSEILNYLWSDVDMKTYTLDLGTEEPGIPSGMRTSPPITCVMRSNVCRIGTLGIRIVAKRSINDHPLQMA